jgi:predicted dehydrogenase
MNHLPVPCSRRSFLRGTLGATLTSTLSAASWSRVLGANGRLRIAAIGVGGKGFSDLTSTAVSPQADIVALCDVDETAGHLGKAAELFPGAARFTDWRRLFDESTTFDACIVSTPDHMHAPIALPAMQLGKHVQCQKPLTHTVFEARQMRLAAERYGVVTQMGNQIQSHPAYRTAVRLVHEGRIGKVREVHAWQSGGMRWLKVDEPPPAAAVPAGLHWDGWLGAAPERPFAADVYHPFSWRAWQDFSNGQLGDFGCHILDPVFMALDLTGPTTIVAEAPPLNDQAWGPRSRVRYRFPETPRTVAGGVTVVWYDGLGHLPDNAMLGLDDEVVLPTSGSIMLGEQGMLLLPHYKMPTLLPAAAFAELEIEPAAARNHYTSWVDACLGTDVVTSSFDYSGPLTETVLLGTAAIRRPATTLSWDATAMRLTGVVDAADLLSKPYRRGWEPHWI